MAGKIEGGGNMGKVGNEGEGCLQMSELPLSKPERLHWRRRSSGKQQAREIAVGGERCHASQENKHSDQVDFVLKPTKVFRGKRGKKRPKNIRVVRDFLREEQEEGVNVNNNEDILFNQGLHQLPGTSTELLPRKRGRPAKRPAEEVDGVQGGGRGHGDKKCEPRLGQSQTTQPMMLLEGICSPQLAVALESRRITRSLNAYLHQCAALLKSPVQDVKNTSADMHDHLTREIYSAETAFASEPGHLTQIMKAYLDRCPLRATPLRSPVRNVRATATSKQDRSTTTGDISASKSSPNHVKNQGLSSLPTSLMSHNLNAIALPSETDNQNTSVSTKLGDQSLSADHGLQDTSEHVADLLVQNHRSGDEYLANPLDLVHIVDNYQPAQEVHMPSNVTINTNKEPASRSKISGACPSRSVSLNLTQMCLRMHDDLADSDEVGSRYDDGLVSVNGYEVKAEVAPILRDIFFRYGDIAKDCTLRAVKSRSSLLENACGIYKRMEGAHFMLITPNELNALLEEVRDLETAKIELGWLHCKLVEILEAKKSFNSLKEDKRRITEATERAKQEIEGHKKELEATMKKIHEKENALAVLEVEEEKLYEKFNNMKSNLKGFYRRSLVHGLL